MVRTAYVVGSGPAGVACARALLDKGVRVVMLDGGTRLEANRAQAVETLGRGQPGDFDPELLALIKENMDATPEGVPLKVAYGSDFPYRGVNKYLPVDISGFSASPSLAVGGLGNVWGASMLPFRADDIAGWPITIADLAPHYEAVLDFVPLAGSRDAIHSVLPLYSRRYQPLRPSRQASDFAKDLAANREALAADGITTGSSRLAVRAQPSEEGPGCAYCGLCMYGCPYGAIYNPASTLEQLRVNPDFEYVDRVVVEKVIEREGRVHITATSMADDQALTFQAERVYLACGVLSSTRILLRSMEAYDLPLPLNDSQYYLFPLLRYRMPAGVESERLHTLAQLFLEISDTSISSHSIHLQVYSYNDLLPTAVGSFLGPLSGMARPAVAQLAGRLLIAQGYLHSSISAAISVALAPPDDGARPRLKVEARAVPATKQAVGRVLAKLMRNRRYLHALPIGLMLKMALPGRGYHSGGTFPMSERPGEFQSDLLGRPHGFERVHVVDSTVFPTIPATTITLSTMANAHRIGSAHNEL